MLDIAQLRKDIAAVAARLKTRPFDLDVDGFNALEGERKSVQMRTEELQAKRNALSKQVGQLKAKGEDASAVLAEVAAIPEEVKALEGQLADIQARLQDYMLNVPNVPHESVPTGRSADDNVEVRRWGTPRAFDFEVQDHVDVGARLGPRLRDRREDFGLALRVAQGPGRAPASRARAVHARPADDRAWLHRVLHAVHRECRQPRRDGAAPEVPRRHVLGRPRAAARTRRSCT